MNKQNIQVNPNTGLFEFLPVSGTLGSRLPPFDNLAIALLNLSIRLGRLAHWLTHPRERSARSAPSKRQAERQVDFGMLNLDQYANEMRQVRLTTIRVLQEVCLPGPAMSVKALREMLDRQLTGLSLSELFIKDGEPRH